ncbi:MAG: hypothetical protein OXG39_18625 [Chloroflexi bacterium]|nr:hypothetical protein [Chloroflexota bacterium]
MTASADGLRAALNFTESDLRANRRGELTIEQVKRLRRNQRRSALIGALVFSALVFASTALIFAGQTENNTIMLLAGLGLTLVNALMVGHIGRDIMRINSDLRSNGVELLAGNVERVLRRGRHRDSYLLKVADQTLYVTKDIFLQFDHLAPYRIYRTRLARILLSAEPASGDRRQASDPPQPTSLPR